MIEYLVEEGSEVERWSLVGLSKAEQGWLIAEPYLNLFLQYSTEPLDTVSVKENKHISRLSDS